MSDGLVNAGQEEMEIAIRGFCRKVSEEINNNFAMRRPQLCGLLDCSIINFARPGAEACKLCHVVPIVAISVHWNVV